MANIKWKRPKLIVLTRNIMQEMVLTSCKAQFDSGGPENDNTGCNMASCWPDCQRHGLS